MGAGSRCVCESGRAILACLRSRARSRCTQPVGTAAPAVRLPNRLLPLFGVTETGQFAVQSKSARRLRRGGRAVDGSGLENRHARKGIGGSNPSLSATVSSIFLNINVIDRIYVTYSDSFLSLQSPLSCQFPSLPLICMTTRHMHDKGLQHQTLLGRIEDSVRICAWTKTSQ